jgi:hypothetical protein
MESEFWAAIFCMVVYGGGTWLLTWVVMEVIDKMAREEE